MLHISPSFMIKGHLKCYYYIQQINWIKYMLIWAYELKTSSRFMVLNYSRGVQEGQFKCNIFSVSVGCTIETLT